MRRDTLGPDHSGPPYSGDAPRGARIRVAVPAPGKRSELAALIVAAA